MRLPRLAAVAALVVLAGCAGLSGDDGGAAPAPIEIAEEPPDPESDVLGWEQGYWYNESIDVDQGDGLSASERRALVARTMARVERVRGLEFESRVPVTTVSADLYGRLGGPSDPAPEYRTFANAKYEALFTINESTDAVASRQSGPTAAAGFYVPRQDAIVLIRSGETARISEATLAHELTHALQDQHFDLSEFERPTREAHNAVDGLTEGDARLVQYEYEDRCAGVWNGSCVEPAPRELEGGAGTLDDVGPYLLRYQPYSDGPAFVQQQRDRGGWERVNGLYEAPPNSTEQTIHPDLYGEDQPTRIRVEDRSSSAWNRLDVPDRPDYARLGEAGLASAFVRPALETQGRVEVVSARSFFTGNSSFDPYNYSTRYSAGWDGDRLVVYTSPTTPEGEFGYVYETVWDSPAQAREFAAGYRELLRVEAASRVPDRQNTWHVPEGTGYGDAYHVNVTGDTVRIVNAPTVEGLSGVHGGAGAPADD